MGALDAYESKLETSTSEALLEARQALLSIPNPSASIWNEPQSENIVEQITFLSTVLMHDMRLKNRPSINATTNSAILYLKALTILLKQAEFHPLLKEVASFYGVQTKMALEHTLHLYACTHPSFAKILNECFQFFKNYQGEGTSFNLFKNYVSWYLYDKEFYSEAEMRKDVELRFLDDVTKGLPELASTLKEQEDKARGAFDSTNSWRYPIHLFADRSLSLFLDQKGKYSKNYKNTITELTQSHPEKAPDWTPARFWIYLRQTYYLYLINAYFTGNSETALSDRFVSCFGPDFCCHDGRKGPTMRYVGNPISYSAMINSYVPKDPKQPMRQLFIDNFYTQSESTAETFFELFQHSNFKGIARNNQNEQLLFQQVLHLEEGGVLSAEQTQDLLSILTFDRLMVPQLLGFFTRNFRLLRDPRFQAVFSHFIFSFKKDGSKTILQECLQDFPHIKNFLFKFLASALEKSQKMQWLECELFFIRTYAMTLRYLADVVPAPVDLDIKSTKLLDYMGTMLRKERGEEERELLHATFISCAIYFDFEEGGPLLDLCKGGQNKGSPPKQLHGKQFLEDYAKGNSLLQTTVIGIPKGVLPYRITVHNDYLFGEEKFVVKQLDEGIYELCDDKKRVFKIVENGASLFTYQKINNHWYQHQCISPFKEPFSTETHPCVKGALAKGVRYWSSMEAPQETLVIEERSGCILAKVKNGCIFHPSDSLQLAYNYNSLIVQLISRISSLENILVWRDEDENIVRIDVTDLNLTLNWDAGKWRSANHSGYYLDSRTVCQNLEPFTHYLILSNSRGKKIVLMVNKGVRPAKQNGCEMLKVVYQAITRDSKLFLLPLDKHFQLKIPEHDEAYLYLIYLALRKFDYALAQKLIHQVKKDIPNWDKKWCLWLNDLEQDEVKNLDRHPEAVCLRLQIRLLMKNLNVQNLDSQHIKGLEQDYASYLAQSKETVGNHLSPDEELKCISVLLKQNDLPSATFHFQLLVRKALLDPAASFPADVVHTMPACKSQVTKAQFPLYIDDKLKAAMIARIDQPEVVINPFRPDRALILNFFYYYQLAKNNKEQNPERQQLEEILRLSRFTDKPDVNAFRIYLTQVFLAPESYPALEELLEDTGPLKLNLLTDIPIPDFWRWNAHTALSCTANGLEKKHAYQVSEGKTAPLAIDAQEFPATSYTRFLHKVPFEEQMKEMNPQFQVLQEMKMFLKRIFRSETELCVKRGYQKLFARVQLKEKALSKKLDLRQTQYRLNQARTVPLRNYLQQLNRLYAQRIQQAESEIIGIAHHFPEMLALKRRGRYLKPLSLQELIVDYGTGSDSAILASNPSIDAEKLKQLKQAIYSYLCMSCEKDHTDILLKKLAEIQTEIDPQKIESLSSAFIATLESKRVFEAHHESVLLVFEFFGKIRLRIDQYNALKQTTGTEDKIELEARTGFGKSKVLIPLWLFLKARSTGASMMTVPASLFVSQQRHLRKVLGKAYDQAVLPIVFNRSMANDEKYLKTFSKRIQIARQQHKVIITTVASLHSIVNLKPKEVLYHPETCSEHCQNTVRELRQIIAEQVAHFVDESKICFNNRQRHDYAMGAPMPVDSEECNDATTLYRVLMLDRDFMRQYSLEFLPLASSSPQTQKTVPLQENYDKQLLQFFSSCLADYLGVPNRFRAVIRQDLEGHYTPKCEEYYVTLGPRKLREYERFKKHLTIHFRRTLFRKTEDEYGLSSNRVAIPFTDGIAKSSSEFSKVEDIIDFTIQANLKKPFAVEDIVGFIENLKLKKVSQEIQPAEEAFLKQLCSKDILEITEEDCLVIASELNKNLRLKLEYIAKAILPQITVYPYKLSSTSFSLLRVIRQIQAASGTVDPDALPPDVKTLEDPTAIMDNLISLWRHVKNDIHVLRDVMPQKKLAELLTRKKEANVLIDAAGTFRELTELETVQIILTHKPEARGVLFFDVEGREWIYDRAQRVSIPRNESGLAGEEIFIFIRKSKAVGTDVEMSLNAQGIVTIDRDTRLDLLLQGTGRMRKLSEGQKASFALSQEDATIIFGKQPCEFKHILQHTIRNQGLAQAEDAFYVLRIYLEDLVEAAIWHAESNCKDLKNAQEIFKALEQFVVKKTQTSINTHLRATRTQLQAKEAVAQLESEILGPIEAFCKEQPDWAYVFDVPAIKKKFHEFVDYRKLALKIAVTGTCDDISETEVTHDVQNINEETADQSNEIDLESEELTDDVTNTPIRGFTPAPPKPWNGNYTACFEKEPQLTLLGIPIYFSPNFRRVSQRDSENKAVQKRAYQMIVLQDSHGDSRIAFLDLHDADAVLTRMAADPIGKGNFYLLSLGVEIASDSRTRRTKKDLSIMILQKLFNGHPILTAEEQSYLKTCNSLEIKKLLIYACKQASYFPKLNSLVALLDNLNQSVS